MNPSQSESNNDGTDSQHPPFSTDRFHGAFRNTNNRSTSPSVASAQGAQTQTPPGQSPSNIDPASPTIAGTTSAATAAATGLNPRSCVICRKRKVKCDKRQPCSNCSRAHVECIFPRPGRAPRRTKKPPDAELLARLRRLEGVVQRLGKGADGEELTPESMSPQQEERKGSLDADASGPIPASLGVAREEGVQGPGTGPGAARIRGGTLKIEKEMGNLVLGEGKSRYVSNTFWASLTDEVAEMKDLVAASSEEEDEAADDGSTPDSFGGHITGGRHTHQEFVFGYSSTANNLRIMHPPAKQVMTYWNLYLENVDPVVRLLHKPTAQQIFAVAAKNPSELSKTTEVLVFAVYFAVVTSLSPEACMSTLGVEREIALARYWYCTEQALARASFLSTQELIVVQAFCLFLCCVRRHDDTKAVWTLTGLLLRMATSLGLHRDGSNFGLPPFQTEMRRRLWWQVCTLDVRASEDQGADPLITTEYFDTRMPLNINDEDIWPNMTEPPVEHERCTEMTFDLVRYEIGGTIRLLSASQSPQRYPEQKLYNTLEAKEALLERLRLRLEDKYLRHCDMSVPLQWVSANVSRLVMAKIWLVIHHPFRHANNGSKLSQETRDRTFLTSIDVIRYSRMLETQQKTSKWNWLFRTYFQWHAVAFLLSELCVRPSGTAVDEAWEVIEEAFPEWDKRGHTHRKSILWKPIAKLIAKARAVRAAELGKRKAFPADGTLGPFPPSGATPCSDASPVLSSPSGPDTIAGLTPGSSVLSAPLSLPRLPLNTYSGDGGSDNIYDLQRAVREGAGNANTANATSISDNDTFSAENMFDFDAMGMSGMGMWLDDPTLGQDSNWEFNNILPWGNFVEGGPGGLGPPGVEDDNGYDGSGGDGMMIGLEGMRGIGGSGGGSNSGGGGMNMGMGMGMGSGMGSGMGIGMEGMEGVEGFGGGGNGRGKAASRPSSQRPPLPVDLSASALWGDGGARTGGV